MKQDDIGQFFKKTKTAKNKTRQEKGKWDEITYFHPLPSYFEQIINQSYGQ